MVTIPRLNQATLQTIKTAPLSPGVALVNVKDRSLSGIRSVIRRTAPASETGRSLGAMTAVPSITIAPEYQNILEDVVGLNNPLKGAQQTQSYEVTAELEIVEMTPENLHVLHPGLVETAYTNGATPVEVGRKFRPKGYVDPTDYIDNMVFAFESSETDLFMVITLFNCLMTDDLEISTDDSGSATGVAGTWTAHVTDTDFDTNTGTYLVPAEIAWVKPPVAV